MIDSDDEITLSTGRTIYANRGILGIDSEGELYEGYDSTINVDKLTPSEKSELAKIAIARWQKVAGINVSEPSQQLSLLCVNGNVRALAAFVIMMRSEMVRPDQVEISSIIFAVCFPEEFKAMNEDWRDFFAKYELQDDGFPAPTRSPST